MVWHPYSKHQTSAQFLISNSQYAQITMNQHLHILCEQRYSHRFGLTSYWEWFMVHAFMYSLTEADFLWIAEDPQPALSLICLSIDMRSNFLLNISLKNSKLSLPFIHCDSHESKIHDDWQWFVHNVYGVICVDVFFFFFFFLQTWNSR